MLGHELLKTKFEGKHTDWRRSDYCVWRDEVALVVVDRECLAFLGQLLIITTTATFALHDCSAFFQTLNFRLDSLR